MRENEIKTFITWEAISGETSQAFWKHSKATEVFSSLIAAIPFSLYSFRLLKTQNNKVLQICYF